MNEWEFTADVAGWINRVLSVNSALPFSQAKCEQRGRGSLKRRDLTLLDKSGLPIVTGEVKLPYRVDGGTPYNAKVVEDARKKAQKAGARYFFTWNVNECVLWETVPASTSWQKRDYRRWTIVNVHSESQFENPHIIGELQSWIPVFLSDLAKIIAGTSPIGYKPPDEKFVEALESALHLPIQLSIDELHKLYAMAPFRNKLDRWMREEQGWVIHADPEGIRENLTRASQFACFALVNKLTFYEALLKRHGVELPKLDIPGRVTTGEGLRLHLEGYFAEAKRITGDYETVFGESHQTIGNIIPFYSDAAVAHWVQLIDQIHMFDFSRMDIEVIGSIFERLIGPEERHKYGQFYTRVEVVDLINSFCIRTGDELVMDPACGGGTFLVRAYARKRELQFNRKHKAILSQLYGADISTFATHLTTINLATRDLINDENYPRIVRSDFFDIEPNKPFVSLPARGKAQGLGPLRHRDVAIPPLDAVIGNPPYVRQEDIPKSPKGGKKAVKKGTKEYYRQLAKHDRGANLTGRSDLHCYFWPHAASFLKPDGWLCFITSSQWLDVEYGFQLQDWILRNFEIEAVFESVDEPWFVGARVATTVTILKRQADPALRMNNTVRFAQLRRPIAEVVSHDGTTAGAMIAADEFRDEIMTLKKNESNQRYRARLVRQGDLWNNGVQLGIVMGKGNTPPSEDRDNQAGIYLGGKWGVYLRAPDLWFELVDSYGDRLSPLGQVADTRYGVKSGNDSFFFPIDVSDTCLDDYQESREFKRVFGLPRNVVSQGQVKLVRCGKGREEIRPIEATYLEPEVHSLMEVGGFTVAPENCRRMILLAESPRTTLQGQYVRKYIEWGEQQGYSKGSTCASRATQSREWYDLTGHIRGQMFWPMAQQYKHAIPTNDGNLICNHNLFDVSWDGDPDLLAGVLNSSWVVLSKFQYGRPVGVEGNLKTEVIDTKMMLVPDPSAGPKRVQKKVASAFRKMKTRPAMQFLSERRMRTMSFTARRKEAELVNLPDVCELDMDDRRELDEAVLELLGVQVKKDRIVLVDRLHDHLRRFFELAREKEEKGIANKNTTSRRGVIRPVDLAVDIYKSIESGEGGLLRQYRGDFLDTRKLFDTFDIPEVGEPKAYHDMYVAHGVEFLKGKKRIGFVTTYIPEQDPLVILAAQTGVRGIVRVPHEAEECEYLRKRYAQFIQMRNDRLNELVAERTADTDMQEKVLEALLAMIANA